MKNIILLSLLFSSNLMAQNLNITKISRKPDFYNMFNLETKKKEHGHISLDCQSFIQKIDFFDKEGSLYSENYISINECQYLYNQTLRCLETNKKKCFNPDYIFNTDCECSE